MQFFIHVSVQIPKYKPLNPLKSTKVKVQERISVQKMLAFNRTLIFIRDVKLVGKKRGQNITLLLSTSDNK